MYELEINKIPEIIEISTINEYDNVILALNNEKG